ncbi:MAG: TerC/Alx family metal homeostasis membrane protein [Planctomycetota bacterium]|nr:TerC/Alx family metal homeostasis membrane protein [Planctomycetota bacterium]
MLWVWIIFVVFVLGMLALDLGVLNRRAHASSAREALMMTGVFVALALAFSVVVYFMYENRWMGVGTAVHDGDAPLTGVQATTKYLTGWLVEYALSMDNIFVISVIFGYFGVPRQYQHRVLFWGILGALVFRGIMIGVGSALITRFHWMIYVFGGLLILTAVKMLLKKEEEVDLEKNAAVRLATRFLPFTREYHGSRFVIRDAAGKLLCTPMLLVLVVVETTDVIFAVDSIPAIFAITRDPFLIFTSNVFAILGLRSLYFALSAIIDKFRYLELSLVFVLFYVGVKMLISEFVHIPPLLSLGVIGSLLGLGVLASLWKDRQEQKQQRPAPIEDLAYAAELTWKRTKKIVIFVIGMTILLLAIPIAFLPGPLGLPVAIGGLALLATEFVWARVMLKKLRERAMALRRQAEELLGLGGSAGSFAPPGDVAGGVPGPSAGRPVSGVGLDGVDRTPGPPGGI